MKNDLLRMIARREKNFNKKKWRVIKFAIIVLSFVFTSIITLVINEINNLNRMFPYQVLIDGLDREVYNAIKNNYNKYNIDEVGIYTDLGTVDGNKYNIIYVDEIGMDANKLKLIEGGLPNNYNEIAINSTSDNKIGDRITLTYFDSFSNKKHVEEFLITARLNTTFKTGENEKSLIVSEDYWKQIAGHGDRNVIYINFNKKEKSEIIRNFELIQDEYDIRTGQIYMNYDYIEGYSANLNQVVIILVFCCVCIFAVRSIIYTIYNIYHNEKLTYIRKLKLIGMTKSDFYHLNQSEIIIVFSHSLWGYLFALIVLLTYMKCQISIILTLSCLIIISLNLYYAIYSATRKQLKEILNNENLRKSKYEYISKGLNKIKRITSNRITLIDLVRRSNRIYKKRNILMRRSIVLTCIMLITVSTLFDSIRFERLMDDVYRYGEEYIIYPDLQNLNEHLIAFQKNNVFSEHLINEIRSIKGIKEVIVNKRVSAMIKDEDGHVYEGSVQINNDLIQKKLENTMMSDQIPDEEIIVNKWRMENAGLEYKIGDYLLVRQIDGSEFLKYRIGGIFNDHNSGELLYLPKDYNAKYNSNYSLSIIIEDELYADTIVNRFNELLQGYPQLRIRSYFTELSNIKSSFSSIFLLLEVIIGLFFVIAIINTINIVNLDLLSRNMDFTLLEINGMTRRNLKKLLLLEYGSNLSITDVCIFFTSYLSSFIIYLIAKACFRIGYLSYRYSYSTFMIVCCISMLVVFLLIMLRANKLSKNLALKLM